jgi:hypothetical protein
MALLFYGVNCCERCLDRCAGNQRGFGDEVRFFDFVLSSFNDAAWCGTG